MPFKIYSEEDLPRQQWLQLTNNCIYLSPEFASIWLTIGGNSIFIAEESEGEIAAGMSGIIFKRKFIKTFQSMPDGFPGGPRYTPGLKEEKKTAYLKSFSFWLKNNNIVRADIHNPEMPFNCHRFKKKDITFHAVDIHDEPFVPMRREVRKQVRAAKRREGEIIMMNGKSHLDALYRLVLETETRHNVVSRYPIEFFEKLIDISIDDNRILWPMVFSGNELIASRICFIDHPMLFMWQAYSSKAQTLLKPEYLLIDYILDYAYNNDLKTVSFGWTPPDAPSLLNFKERWGAAGRTIPYFVYYSKLGNLLYMLKS